MTASVQLLRPPTLRYANPYPALQPALDVVNMVGAGQPVPVQDMVKARAVLLDHTDDEPTSAIEVLTAAINAHCAKMDADAMAAARRGTIRRALCDAAGLAMIGLAVWAALSVRGM